MHNRHCPPTQRIDTWIVVIGGFLQTSWSGGLVRLWRKIHNRYAAPSCAVTAHAWNDDWSGLAELMRGSGARRIVLVGYSWGVGHGAMTLARELKGRGITVERVISCDGVAHPRFLKVRAVFNWIMPPPRIFVPANVHHVHFVRQDTNTPRGHRFTAENGTQLHNHGLIGAGFTHQDADDSPVFHDLTLNLLEQELGPGNVERMCA